MIIHRENKYLTILINFGKFPFKRFKEYNSPQYVCVCDKQGILLLEMSCYYIDVEINLKFMIMSFITIYPCLQYFSVICVSHITEKYSRLN